MSVYVISKQGSLCSRCPYGTGKNDQCTHPLKEKWQNLKFRKCCFLEEESANFNDLKKNFLDLDIVSVRVCV